MDNPIPQGAQGKQPQDEADANLHAIKISIDSLADKINPTEAQQYERDKWPRRAAKATIIYVGITILIFIATAYQVYLSRQNIIESNRAWLAPTTFTFIKSIDDPDGPVVEVNYQNVGKSPALHVNNSMGLLPIPLNKPLLTPRDVPDLKDTHWGDADIAFRRACNSNHPLVNGQSIFPEINTETDMISGFIETDTNKVDRKPLRDGTSIVIVAGCLAYMTFGEVHRTGFCRFIAKHRTGSWEFLSCFGGNFAD